MNTKETLPRKIGEYFGMLMFLGGVLVVGVGGFVLLCILTYAMVTENLALGVVTGMLLFAPLVFGVLWLILGSAALLGERSAQRASDLLASSGGKPAEDPAELL